MISFNNLNYLKIKKTKLALILIFMNMPLFVGCAGDEATMPKSQTSVRGLTTPTN